MTNDYEIADDNRESLIWTKEQLLAPLRAGMEAPPHPMRLGATERDYYLLGSAGVAAGRAEAGRRGASTAEGTAERALPRRRWPPPARRTRDAAGRDRADRPGEQE